MSNVRLTRDSPADGDVPKPLDPLQHLVQDLPADIVKEKVGFLRKGRLEILGKRGGLVVDALVRPERLDPVAFALGGYADDALAPHDVLGDLDEAAPDRSGRAGNDERMFGFEVHLAERARPGREAVDAEGGQSEETRAGTGVSSSLLELTVRPP